MPKAQVLVTLTAEALVEIPEGVEDVDAYCRENVELAWGELRVESIVQPAAVSVEHYYVDEPEPVPEPVEETAPEPELEPEPAIEAVAAIPEPTISPDDTLPLPPLDATPQAEEPRVEIDLVSLVDDPAYRDLIRSAVRARAERLIEEVVNQVVSELEPLLQRHITKNARGAS